jgi:hypothetical protein
VPRPSPVNAGRYTIDDVQKRIERMRVACRVEPIEIYKAIGMKQSAWSKKMRSATSTFTVVELGAIADYFARLVDKPLTGWPLVTVEVSDRLDALNRRD